MRLWWILHGIDVIFRSFLEHNLFTQRALGGGIGIGTEFGGYHCFIRAINIPSSRDQHNQPNETNISCKFTAQSQGDLPWIRANVLVSRVSIAVISNKISHCSILLNLMVQYIQTVNINGDVWLHKFKQHLAHKQTRKRFTTILLRYCI